MLTWQSFARASATSGVLHTASDLLAQTLERSDARGAGERAGVNWSRVGKFALVGACLHGPYFNVAYPLLDRIVRGTTVGVVVLKAMVGQVSVFPMYLPLFFAARAALDGADVDQMRAAVRSKLWPTYVAGWAVWPAANTLFFLYVPGQYRVLAANVVGLGWQAFMSRQAAQASAVAIGVV